VKHLESCADLRLLLLDQALLQDQLRLLLHLVLQLIQTLRRLHEVLDTGGHVQPQLGAVVEDAFD